MLINSILNGNLEDEFYKKKIIYFKESIQKILLCEYKLAENDWNLLDNLMQNLFLLTLGCVLLNLSHIHI